MNEHRRDSDQWVNRAYKIIGMIVTILAAGTAFGWVKTKIEDHEVRIGRLEDKMDRVVSNTDILVERLIRK